METEKFRITLNSPENIYFAGQELKGEITLKIQKKIKIRGIKFRISGKGKCNWCELLRRESNSTTFADKSNPRSIFYSAKETYLVDELYIFGSTTARSVELDVGEHSYNFIYNLHINLPSSINGQYGSIKYKCKFIIEKPWSFDEKYEIPITIVKYSMMPIHTSPNQRNILQEVTKNVGVFGSAPISMVAKLPLNFAVRGEKLNLCVTVNNRSRIDIERLKFSIRQIVSFFSQQPICIRKEQIIKIFKKEAGGVQKKSTRDFDHELQVPSCQPTDNQTSTIIHVRYEVVVEANLPGLYKNLCLSLPFTICSAELRPGVSNSNANSSIGWYLGYPNPNISICSGSSMSQSIGSPSHVSGDTSSLYSTASDSILSDDSLTFRRNGSISSNNRNSIRNSIAGSAPASTGANFMNYRQSHGFIPELPPSYEELFGTASQSTSSPTAPPLSSPSPPLLKIIIRD